MDRRNSWKEMIRELGYYGEWHCCPENYEAAFGSYPLTYSEYLTSYCGLPKGIQLVDYCKALSIHTLTHPNVVKAFNDEVKELIARHTYAKDFNMLIGE